MKVILFAFYYGKLQLSVRLGIYRTVNPLNLKWRWNHWHDQYRRRRTRIL